MKELSERGNKTKAKIVETARELFHKNGVRATSVDQILKLSGTGKSQFYHYFNSKEDVVHEVLQFYMIMTKSGQGPITTYINNWEDLENFFYDYVRGVKLFNCQRSCPVGSIGNELGSENEEIREDVNLILDFTRNNIFHFFNDLKNKGKLSSTAEPDSMADFCIATVQGALLLSKVRKDSRVAVHTVYHALKHLKSFSQ